MQSWLASLFNIIYWVIIFFALAFTFLFCFNLSKIDAFERNATPIVQEMSNPITDTKQQQQISNLNKRYEYDNGSKYMYQVMPDGYYAKTDNNNKETRWKTTVDYGTPIQYTIREDIPFLFFGKDQSLGDYTSNISVTTSCQANTDNQKNSSNGIIQ